MSEQEPPEKSKEEALWDSIDQDFERGLYLQAYARARSAFGPDLKKWRGARERILAGRLATRLGHPRLGRAILWLAHRNHRNHAAATIAWAETVLAERGAWMAEQTLQRIQTRSDLSEQETAELCRVRAMIFSVRGDVPHALDLSQRAATFPSASCLLVRGTVMLAAHRLPEAVEIAKYVLENHPSNAEALHLLARALGCLSEGRQALETLWAGVQASECETIAWNYAWALTIQGSYQVATQALHYARSLVPLANEEVQLRYRRLENWLETAIDGLPPWVSVPRLLDRQHRITQGGEGPFAQRTRIVNSEQVVREFILDRESLQTTLEAGLALSVWYEDENEGRWLTIVGFDERFREVLAQDDDSGLLATLPINPLLDSMRHSGPRALIAVEPANAKKLQELALPFAAELDALYTLTRASQTGDIQDVLRIARDLIRCRCLPIAIQAVLQYGETFHDWVVILRAVEEANQILPGNAYFRRIRTRALMKLNRFNDAYELVSRACADAHVSYAERVDFAEILTHIPNAGSEAQLQLYLASWLRPTDARWHMVASRLAMNQSREDEALTHAIIGCWLDRYSAEGAEMLLQTAIQLNRLSSIVDIIEERALSQENKQASAYGTYLAAYAHGENEQKMHEIITSGMSQFPDDPKFRARCVAILAGALRLEEAQTFMQAWPGNPNCPQRLESEALLAGHQGLYENLVSSRKRLLEMFPQSPATLDALGDALRIRNGIAAARDVVIAHAMAKGKDNPAFLPVALRWIDMESEPKRFEYIARSYLTQNSHAIKVWLALGEAFINQHRFRDAAEIATRLCERFPRDSSGLLLQGEIAMSQGHLAEARDHLAQAWKMDSNAWIAVVLSTWWQACETHDQYYTVVNHAAERLINGHPDDALLNLWITASPTVSTQQERTNFLKRLSEHHKGWVSAAIAEATLASTIPPVLERSLRSLAALENLSRKLPLEPNLRYQVGLLQISAGLVKEGIVSLRRAMELAPWHIEIVIKLIDTLFHIGQYSEADTILDKALSQLPTNQNLVLLKAHRLAHTGKMDEALKLTENLASTCTEEPEFIGFAMSYAHREEDVARLISQLRTRAESSASNLTAALAYGQILAQHGLWKDLLPLSSSILARDATAVAGARLRILALRGLGRWNEARSWLREWAGSKRHQMEIDDLMIDLEMEGGFPAQAIERALRVLRVQPCHDEIWWAIREILGGSQVTERHRQAIEAIFKTHPRLLTEQRICEIVALENAVAIGDDALISKRLLNCIVTENLEDSDRLHCLHKALSPAVALYVLDGALRAALAGKIGGLVLGELIAHVSIKVNKNDITNIRSLIVRILGRGRATEIWLNYLLSRNGTLSSSLFRVRHQRQMQIYPELWAWVLRAELEADLEQGWNLVANWERRGGLKAWMLVPLVFAHWIRGDAVKAYEIAILIERRVLAGEPISHSEFADIQCFLYFNEACKRQLGKTRERSLVRRIDQTPNNDSVLFRLGGNLIIGLQDASLFNDKSSVKDYARNQYQQMLALRNRNASPIRLSVLQETENWIRTHAPNIYEEVIVTEKGQDTLARQRIGA